MTIDLAARRSGDLEVGANVELGLRCSYGRRLHDLEVHAPFLEELVIETGLRVVVACVKADTAGELLTERFSHFPGREIASADQLAGFGVDVLDEIAVLRDPPDVLQAGAAVIDEDVATLVGVHHQLLTVAIEHHELADRAVKVPGIVRQFLMIEFELAGIDVET